MDFKPISGCYILKKKGYEGFLDQSVLKHVIFLIYYTVDYVMKSHIKKPDL